ncbi:trypsin-like cysteine/serine peptidase domain-containing protein [Gigaspora rosea]|uniref:Trypsin-like cysteine/serine peptidase domain-containing protein n=1 Tax=Gigaspora rosea TaxID=44941 RepID=A0A397VDU7_9GLOM|nr:trypsin-like cysteine/serine peptidase domain-containing protein [Gigaspora rosea]
MVTRNKHFLISLLSFLFILQNHSMIHAQYEPLAELWEVSVSEVPTLLTIEKNLILVDSILTPILDNSSFGGTYISVKANKVFINTINSSMIPIIKASPKIQPYINLLSFKNATNSTFRLNSSFNELTTLAQNLKANNVMIGINPKFNNIVIYLNQKDNETNKNFIDSATKFYPIMNYSTSSTNSTTLRSKIEERQIYERILDGEGLHNIFGEQICSVGPLMKDNFNQFFYLTAGHCFANQPLNPAGFVDFYHLPWYSPPTYDYIGQLEHYSISPYDFGLIHVINPIMLLSAIIKNNDYERYQELFIEDSASVISVGVHLCKSGYTTHVTCGEVTELNAAIVTDFGTKIKLETIVFDAISFEGDSGGPVYSNALHLEPFVTVVGIAINAISSDDLDRTAALPLDVVRRFFDLTLILTS